MSEKSKTSKEALVDPLRKDEGLVKDKDPAEDWPKKKKVASKKDEENPMSEEDKQLKDELDGLVEALVAATTDAKRKTIITDVSTQIRTSTSSMTSVPKPLKFLRSHFATLESVHEKLDKSESKKDLADVLSVLAMTIVGDGCESLNYKLKGNALEIATWGHEYVRNLAAEIARDYARRREEEQSVDELMALVDKMVPYYISQNDESEACDLLLEVEQIEKIADAVDKANFERVCLYLASFANFVPGPEDETILRLVLNLYRKHDDPTNALRYAMKLHDMKIVKEIFHAIPKSEHTLRSQMAYMLGEQRMFILDDDEDADEMADDEEEVYENEEEEEAAMDRAEKLQRQINNAYLSEAFLILAEDLDVLEPKMPEDIYKSHLDTTRPSGSGVDSARQNLASTFVNAFVNAGFGHDRLMTDNVGHEWIYKNKEHGMMCAAASLGAVMLWDVDGALSQIDTLLEFSSEDYIKAGALLSVGIVNSGVRHEVDPAIALLCDYVESDKPAIQQGSLLGLGMAYAGSARSDIMELLLLVLENESASDVAIGHAALALGLIFVGTGNSLAATTLTQLFFERPEDTLKSTHFRFVSLGLGLIFLARQDEADVTIATMSAVEGTHGAYARLTVETCAYAGTGNVLKVQELLHQIAHEALPEDAPEPAELGVAVLGVALIALGEPVGEEMSRRTFEHLLQYGEPAVKRAVPLAIALSHLSNPDVYAVDTLSKLSHDASAPVAQAAILGLGLVSAGTNNARVAGLLRNLASFFANEPANLFAVRVAQGLTHMGKGLMTLQPFTSAGLLLSPVALGGLLAFMHSSLDLEGLLLGKYAHLFYTLVTAMRPRMLITYDEEGKVLNVPVRVGQAVDVVAEPGKRKTITGFQTHTTPVLLAHGERCELATDEFLPVSSVLEQMVILRDNPDAPPKTAEQKKADKQRAEEREAERRKRIELREQRAKDAANK